MVLSPVAAGRKTPRAAAGKGKGRASEGVDLEGIKGAAEARNLVEELAKGAEEQEMEAEKRRRRESRRVRKHYIDGVTGIGVGVESVEKGWERYLAVSL
jgi:hypothetical protein